MPNKNFLTPHDIVRDTTLTIAEKRALLKERAYDEAELMVATEEGMTGHIPARIRGARRALRDLQVTPAINQTKQGCL